MCQKLLTSVTTRLRCLFWRAGSLTDAASVVHTLGVRLPCCQRLVQDSCGMSYPVTLVDVDNSAASVIPENLARAGESLSICTHSIRKCSNPASMDSHHIRTDTLRKQPFLLIIQSQAHHMAVQAQAPHLPDHTPLGAQLPPQLLSTGQ